MNQTRFTKFGKIERNVTMLVAIWLCFSPFILGFIGNAYASVSAFLSATIILLVSQLGDFDRPHLVEWINITAATILILSPWMFNYADIFVALINAEICGITIILFSYIAFHQESDETEEETHHHPT